MYLDVNLNFEQLFSLISCLGLDVDFGLIQLQCDAIGFGKEHFGILDPQSKGEFEVGASSALIAIPSVASDLLARIFCGSDWN